jgi:hypothetical protein
MLSNPDLSSQLFAEAELIAAIGMLFERATPRPSARKRKISLQDAAQALFDV